MHLARTSPKVGNVALFHLLHHNPINLALLPLCRTNVSFLNSIMATLPHLSINHCIRIKILLEHRININNLRSDNFHLPLNFNRISHHRSSTLLRTSELSMHKMNMMIFHPISRWRGTTGSKGMVQKTWGLLPCSFPNAM